MKMTHASTVGVVLAAISFGAIAQPAPYPGPPPPDMAITTNQTQLQFMTLTSPWTRRICELQGLYPATPPVCVPRSQRALYKARTRMIEVLSGSSVLPEEIVDDLLTDVCKEAAANNTHERCTRTTMQFAFELWETFRRERFGRTESSASLGTSSGSCSDARNARSARCKGERPATTPSPPVAPPTQSGGNERRPAGTCVKQTMIGAVNIWHYTNTCSKAVEATITRTCTVSDPSTAGRSRSVTVVIGGGETLRFDRQQYFGGFCEALAGNSSTEGVTEQYFR